MNHAAANSLLRSSYRHGDLPRALLQAGISLARAGGPEAVVLREATRRAGVAPNAAYRHFANRAALLAAVRSCALSALAQEMEAELTRSAHAADAAEAARARLRAIGTAYIRFALRETGLFRTAFGQREPAVGAVASAKVSVSGPNPFQLLGAALDQMVTAGVLPAERRLDAEYLAWSAVHGLAMLVIEGPLRHMDRAKVTTIGQRVVQMVEKGL